MFLLLLRIDKFSEVERPVLNRHFVHSKVFDIPEVGQIEYEFVKLNLILLS